MRKTMSDLWNGNIAPCEHCGANDPQANRQYHLMERMREVLYGELSQTQRETFQKYRDYSEEFLLRMMELAFYEGFSLGNRLAIESLD